MAKPLEIYREYQKRLRAWDLAHLDEVVDGESFMQTYVGFTPRETVGFVAALHTIQKTLFSAFSDTQVTTEEVVEGPETVVLRNSTKATHIGEFLGIPPTGRRITYDSVTIAHIKDGRVVGQWVQLDLWGIYQQLTAEERLP
jgi:predicted ester cyclase